MGGDGRLALTAITAAIGGNVSGSGADMVQAAAINYIQGKGAKAIKDYIETYHGGDDKLRAAFQGILACAGSAAKGGDCGSAALGAAGSILINKIMGGTEVIDPKTGKKRPMTLEERQERENIINTLLTGTVDLLGGDAAATNVAAKIEMENNQYSHGWGKDRANENNAKNMDIAQKLLENPEAYEKLSQVEKNAVHACAEFGGSSCNNVPEAVLSGGYNPSGAKYVALGGKVVGDVVESLVDPTDPLNYIPLLGSVFKSGESIFKVTKVLKDGTRVVEEVKGVQAVSAGSIKTESFYKKKDIDRLIFDTAGNVEKPAEARAALDLERTTLGTLERIPAKGNDALPDFIYTSGPFEGKTVDFMFTGARGDAEELANMNKFFNKNWEDARGKTGTKSKIIEHLDKADFVPLDLRTLEPANRQIVLDFVVNDLSDKQRAKIILMGEK